MSFEAYEKAGISVSQSYFGVSDEVELLVTAFDPPEAKPGTPTLVFVPGWISLLSGWHEVLGQLCPCCRVLYIETREKKSARLPSLKREFSVERMADDIIEAVEALVPENAPFCYAASSLGATVVLEAMSRQSRAPNAAMLVGPIAQMHFPALGLAFARILHPSLFFVFKPWLKWYLANIRCDKKKEPEQVAKYFATIDAAEPARLKKNAFAIRHYSLWEKLPKIGAPVTVFGARTDKVHGLETLEKIAAALPAGRLEILESNKETHSERCGRIMARIIAGA
ncbi:MAG: alpha/beta hydrolase [Desulfatibacillaceae bacterium]|nr:alpha/beta hydrolase [Desulfatibacillaceae bacterium]